MTSAADASTVEFGPFSFNLGRRELKRQGVAIVISSRAAEILRALIMANGELLSKQDLLRIVWPGVVVDDNTLAVHISGLRKALGEDAAGSYIRTVQGQGYCFVKGTRAPEGDFPPSSATLDGKPSIAVLPFDNMSGDPAQEYFADGITEDIITALAASKWFFVIARNSTFIYKGMAVDVRQVGRELGVRYVLEGSVRKSGDKLRITGQLIETENGRHIWAHKYDGDLEDVFDLQDHVTASVAAAIEPNLRASELERSRRKPTSSLAAYDHVLRALPKIDTVITRESTEEAIKQLRTAIRLDPHYEHAKALLAITHAASQGQGWSTPEGVTEGVECAERAIASRTHDAETLALAALGLAFLDRQYERALRVVEQAYASGPNLFAVASAAGWLNFVSGDAAAALTRFERAHRLNPMDPIGGFSYSGRSLSLCFLGRAEEGMIVAQRAVAMAPNLASPRRTLIVNLVELGRMEEAREQLKELLRISPGHTTRSLTRVFEPIYWERYMANLRKAGLPD